MSTIKEARRRQRRFKLFLKIFLIIAIIIGIFAALALTVFVVKDVEIEGNEIYDAETIKSSILADPYSEYTLYLIWKYDIMPQEEMPFVEKLEVKLISPSKVKIVVYEKAIIGYLYDDQSSTYYYFDKDGIVVEVSDTLVENATKVTGLDAEGLELYGSINDADSDVLGYLLDLSQLLEKYSLEADSITIGKNATVSLKIGKIEIELGKNQYTEAKILRISEILKQLKNESGKIDLSEWSKSSDDIIFQSSD